MILAMENAGQLIEDEELRAQIKGSGIGTSATRAEILLGRTDPGEVVIDELVGVWIALLPLGAGQWSWPGLVWAFALFRLFDIWKPWPVHASENWLPAGWGIMLDDILAGLMAMCCMLVLRALGWV